MLFKCIYNYSKTLIIKILSKILKYKNKWKFLDLNKSLNATIKALLKTLIFPFIVKFLSLLLLNPANIIQLVFRTPKHNNQGEAVLAAAVKSQDNSHNSYKHDLQQQQHHHHEQKQLQQITSNNFNNYHDRHFEVLCLISTVSTVHFVCWLVWSFIHSFIAKNTKHFWTLLLFTDRILLYFLILSVKDHSDC